MRIDIMTRNGLFGYVDDDGPDTEATARFLDTVAVPGGFTPDDGDAYLEALFAILRGGSYLWAQPATATVAALERVSAREELLEGAGAAWDESKHSRYARGTPVRGREGGGRFAPRTTTSEIADLLVSDFGMTSADAGLLVDTALGGPGDVGIHPRVR